MKMKAGEILFRQVQTYNVMLKEFHVGVERCRDARFCVSTSVFAVLKQPICLK
jgi:hypothetical protein